MPQQTCEARWCHIPALQSFPGLFMRKLYQLLARLSTKGGDKGWSGNGNISGRYCSETLLNVQAQLLATSSDLWNYDRSRCLTCLQKKGAAVNGT